MKLKLEEKRKENSDVFSFIFQPQEPVSWQAGQYMVYYIPHNNPDNRGETRHFTISSAPFQKKIMLTTHYLFEESSSLKKALFAHKPGDIVEGVKVDGTFTLRPEEKKLVFIAGGIGITPYHAMLLELVRNKDYRNIILLYSNKDEGHVVFKDTIERLTKEYPGFKVFYLFSPQRADAGFIQRTVPDFAERVFYLSGPIRMVKAVEEVLQQLEVPLENIRKDYFPRVDE